MLGRSTSDRGGGAPRGRGWSRDACGTTTIEYALIASLVAFGLIGSARLVGNNIGVVLGAVTGGLGGEAPTSGPAPAVTSAAVPARGG